MSIWKRGLISTTLIALAPAAIERPADSRLARASCDLSSRVVVHDSTSPEPVCRAAAAALAFLDTCHVAPEGAVHVRVADHLDSPVQPALAYFDARAVEVVVPDLPTAEAMTRGSGFFGLPMNRALYEGLVAHEIAHATVADASHLNAQINPAPHEYVAYATLFATLPDDLQARILRGYSYQAPITEHELSALYWSLAPADFGVKAHLHFAMPANGCRFLKDLIAGEERLPTGLE
jgi:hypothetical protein